MATTNTPVSADVEAAARALALVARMAADDLAPYVRALKAFELPPEYGLVLNGIIGDLEQAANRYHAAVATRNGVAP